MRKTILVVEDEQSIADTICYALNTENFDVIWKQLGNESVQWLKENHADAVILDVGLPDISGFDVCREIRSFSQVPVIFLTARKEEIDRVVGLEIGGDDYLVKPFSPRELTARVKAILRRAQPKSNTPISSASSLSLLVDEQKSRITFRDHTLDLTRYEYRLLKLLLSQPERVFSREQIMEHVWEAPEASLDRTVDAHIKSLRAKLRDVGADDALIKTHRGIGYSFDPSADS